MQSNKRYWAILIVTILTGLVFGATIQVPHDFKTIRSAIDSAKTGDTITVAAGIYNERLKLKEGLTLLGSDVDSTIIDGSGAGDLIIAADRCVIANFTLSNAGDLYSAIICEGGSPTIRHNKIIENGVGIRCTDNASAVIEYNVIARCDDGSDYGTVAIACIKSSPTIRNNTIAYNAAHFAVLCDSASPQIINNIIVNNWGGIGCLNNSMPILSYNDVWSNVTFGDYSGCPAAKNSISADPLFVDHAANDFRLKPNSPCVATGDPSHSACPGHKPNMGALDAK
jgi:parallel beta-helix repeat protein